jgi:hypothetical protein
MQIGTIYSKSLGTPSTLKICRNMLKTALGWRRDFYRKELGNPRTNQENDRSVARKAALAYYP